MTTRIQQVLAILTREMNAQPAGHVHDFLSLLIQNLTILSLDHGDLPSIQFWNTIIQHNQATVFMDPTAQEFNIFHASNPNYGAVFIIGGVPDVEDVADLVSTLNTSGQTSFDANVLTLEAAWGNAVRFLYRGWQAYAARLSATHNPAAQAFGNVLSGINSVSAASVAVHYAVLTVMEYLNLNTAAAIVGNSNAQPILTHIGELLPTLFGAAFHAGAAPNAAQVEQLKHNIWPAANVPLSATADVIASFQTNLFQAMAKYPVQAKALIALLGPITGPDLVKKFGQFPPPPPPPSGSSILVEASGASTWSVGVDNDYVALGQVGKLNPTNVAIKLDRGATTTINLNYGDATHPAALVGRMLVSNFNPAHPVVTIQRIESGSDFQNGVPRFLDITSVARVTGAMVTVSLPDMKVGPVSISGYSFPVAGLGIQVSMTVGNAHEAFDQAAPVWHSLAKPGQRPDVNIANAALVPDAENVIALLRDGLNSAKIVANMLAGGHTQTNAAAIMTVAEELLGCSNRQISDESAKLVNIKKDQVDIGGYRDECIILEKQLLEREKIDGKEKVFSGFWSNTFLGYTNNIAAGPSYGEDAAANAMATKLGGGSTEVELFDGLRYIGYTESTRLILNVDLINTIQSSYDGGIEGVLDTPHLPISLPRIDWSNSLWFLQSAADWKSQYDNAFAATYTAFDFKAAISTSWH